MRDAFRSSGYSLPLKRLRLVSRLLLLLVFSDAPTSFAQAAPPPPYRIVGMVVSALDGYPLRRCQMAAIMSNAAPGPDRRPIEMLSDERGHFDLALPSAGTWHLTASGSNLRRQSYEGHNGFFTGIVLTAAQPVFRVVFRAVPDAVMTGTVIDEASEPIRNAPVFLIADDPVAGLFNRPRNARMQQSTTDDRGRYEFSGLDAGAYLVCVRARPWYAPQGTEPWAATDLGPSLDVVYPITWFPGTTDDTSATPLTVHAGERVEANFHLLTMPSAHLRLPAQTPDPSGGDRTLRRPAQVTLLLPNGATQQVFGNFVATASGEMDMGGLAPGTYQLTLPENRQGEPRRTTILHLASGGVVSAVDRGTVESTVTLSVDGDTAADTSAVLFTDTVTGRAVRFNNGRGRPGSFNPSRTGTSGRQRLSETDSGEGLRTLSADRTGTGTRTPATLDLPPGRYEVSVEGNSGAFLTGLTAKGAETEGRFVTVHEGSASLVAHLASGLANVEGTVHFHGKPSAGALVLLVPASLGASTSLATVHQDQSNTDGSFRLTGVTPGPYILVAIDHGWGVRWTDLESLAPYLLHGTPLDLKVSAAVRSSLEASAL